MAEPKKKTIILFKATTGDDDSFAELLEANNYNVISIKTLDFEYKNLQVLKSKLKQFENYRGIIFTSPRCVFAVEKALKNTRINEEWLQKENYVVGPKTYELAMEILKLDCPGKDSGNARNLAEVIGDTKSENSLKFLYPCGSLATDTLTKILGENSLESVVVYETIQSQSLYEDIKRGTSDFKISIDYVVFFSPSGVNAVEKYRGHLKLDELKIIAIGPTTESALKDLNLPVFDKAGKPNAESLLAVINNK